MKELTESDYKQIILRRDPRYDGRLYFGVKTTKIYCRPVCPARPKFENIVVYKSPSEAEKAGCRPCLRCRPDLAPGNRFINPGAKLAASGLRLIEESDSWNLSVKSMAETLKISTRHLRRVFDEQLGASPTRIMQSRKLHLAKQLLLETGQSISDIAFTAGFNSVRSFNESFKACYRATPSEIRTSKRTKVLDGDSITLSVIVRKPYDFAAILAFLKRHSAQGIERVRDNCYERYIPNNQSYSTLTVSINKKQNSLLVHLKGFELDQVLPVLLKVRRLFDVDHNPAHLPEIQQTEKKGVRVAGAFDPFEVAVSIVLSQLISIKQATQKLSELILQFGSVIDVKKSVFRFPAPACLMGAEVEKIGITRTKAEAIRALSKMVYKNEICFSYSADLAKTRRTLLSIKGIGPWTTEMIMMRCFGDADACPEGDLIIKRALEQKLVDETLWKTNRSYMTHYVWNVFAASLSKR